MTVKVTGGEAALDMKLPAKKEEKESVRNEAPEKPAVFMSEAEPELTTVRYSAGRSRKSGFFGIVFAQLVITAVTGIGLWAAAAFGAGQAGEICERLIGLFR